MNKWILIRKEWPDRGPRHHKRARWVYIIHSQHVTRQYWIGFSRSWLLMYLANACDILLWRSISSWVAPMQRRFDVRVCVRAGTTGVYWMANMWLCLCNEEVTCENVMCKLLTWPKFRSTLFIKEIRDVCVQEHNYNFFFSRFFASVVEMVDFIYMAIGYMCSRYIYLLLRYDGINMYFVELSISFFRWFFFLSSLYCQLVLIEIVNGSLDLNSNDRYSLSIWMHEFCTFSYCAYRS